MFNSRKTRKTYLETDLLSFVKSIKDKPMQDHELEKRISSFSRSLIQKYDIKMNAASEYTAEQKELVNEGKTEFNSMCLKKFISLVYEKQNFVACKKNINECYRFLIKIKPMISVSDFKLNSVKVLDDILNKGYSSISKINDLSMIALLVSELRMKNTFKKYRNNITKLQPDAIRDVRNLKSNVKVEVYDCNDIMFIFQNIIRRKYSKGIAKIYICHLSYIVHNTSQRNLMNLALDFFEGGKRMFQLALRHCTSTFNLCLSFALLLEMLEEINPDLIKGEYQVIFINSLKLIQKEKEKVEKEEQNIPLFKPQT